jgi:hypothetical protein
VDASAGCVANTDCSGAQYCLFTVTQQGCAKTGKCVARPTNLTSTDLAPVCGCDGVTYWNAQLAALRGGTVQTQGACTQQALSCAQNKACPGDAKCNQIRASAQNCGGGGGGGGVCWAVPDTCPPATAPGAPVSNRTRICNNLAVCSTLCESITSEKSFYRLTVDESKSCL